MKNDTSFYFKRKRAELELLLNTLAPRSVTALSSQPYWLNAAKDPSFESVLKSKVAWRSQFLADFHLSNANLTETLVAPPLLPEAKVATQDFTYQRFDLRYEANCFLRLLYGPWEPWEGTTFPSAPGLFTSSGMAATTSLLSACQNIFRDGMQIYLQSDSFFETQSFVKLYLPGARITEDVSALKDQALIFIDSIGSYAHVDVLKSLPQIEPSLVIFDTTCYDRNDERIKYVINHCFKHEWPLYLVRSHMKLDSLGTESGRLGSIVAILPDENQTIFQVASNFVSLAGQNYTPASLFPLLSAPIAIALGQARNQLIRRNTRKAAELLSETLGSQRVRKFHHDLFLAINLNEHEFSETDRQKLAESLMELGLPVRAASSFGFDFIALDQFRDRNLLSPTIRVAFADLPDEQIEHFCYEITKRFGA